MQVTIVPAEKTTDVVKRMFYIAWKACGGPMGMGFLRDRGPAQSEDEIWANVCNAGDYPGQRTFDPGKSGEAYGDYVFGRMMKMGVGFNPSTGAITTRDSELRIDYQSWCMAYPTYRVLLDAAANEVGAEVQEPQLAT
jgi:hypothetical protein